MEEQIKSLALQLHGAKQKKQEIERHIKSVERKLLDQKEVSQLLLPLNNEGGERTQDGITVEIKREHVWDQFLLDELLESMPRESWPSFVAQVTNYKVDMRGFTAWAMAHPDEAGRRHACHSIKLGKERVKSIDPDKLNQPEEEVRP